MHYRPTSSLLAMAVMLLTLAGCASVDEYGNPLPMGETAKGLGIGAATGAATGALIGSASADAGKGALIGAVGGAIVGAMVGNYMEQQRKDFERVLADEIARGDISVTKQPDNSLVVGMTSSTTFDLDSDVIKPGFYSTMDKISGVVNKYGKTRLEIAGYTDNTGSAEYNLDLSRRRAGAVEAYLLSDSVVPQRLSSIGYGEEYPISSNDSDYGRALNRRVTITIIPVVEETATNA
ncbi:MAG TPA: flagellar motor protein MotB [Chromatiaceae bacterium]|jgi:outer membrane protein OmpA-like peptidoglycan-associated protein|nr:MAG: OmpA family protein [Thiohalocapsa sp. PB-PSB1]HBG95613.1 flagellar motor protein MotB [Chromatiaceae bacterium]HCS88491.1 flagellar motor protein MotB [Chromatiaceae bacterium]